MKKSWTHLIVFAVLSGLSSLSRIWSVFFTSFDEEKLRHSYEKAGIPNVDEVISTTRASVELQSNMVMKIFAVLLLLAMVAVVVYLVRKQGETASYIYIGYLFGTLILSTYSFVAGRAVIQTMTDETFRSVTNATILGGYIAKIALFALFFGLTVFFHLRKPKVLPDTAQNATDI
ncbi:ABC transporter permease [Streptococcus gallinaceus]|uniref:ABC-type multidrug transport system fused ATPase/permease subunit n=1 Tax=Streptococcus gallinaceus TaxID=165758 RepID=A0ABV2JNX9_9STRE|nr:MFS transporter [Streptococcus gallinaceus]MCP1639493.1 ABC-type multidrug transport system fused ATPase/permease subunit [Streptococcus gallinaceus]MCP1770276.1 ABC-type multidrug transport system fused ATPase/permease subunit [Streptococcus gallinaceus]